MKIYYRLAGERQWLEGRTEDISKTGVLFLADHPLKIGSQLQMRLMLPAMKSSEFRAEIACAGRIVRELARADRNPPCAMAASIARCRLVRRGAKYDDPVPYDNRNSSRKCL